MTLRELSERYGRSRRWIQEEIHRYEPTLKRRIPRAVTLVMDATFFGKREEKFGLLVAMDSASSEPIAYDFIVGETKESYRRLIDQIRKDGFGIQAVVLDGRPGISALFPGIPVQMCHFHMQAILTRKLTRNPKLEASRSLKALSASLDRYTQEEFTRTLENWHTGYANFLKEKSINEVTGSWQYKHRAIRSAYFSLKRFLPLLYTYKNHPELNIPNTTNHLDGGCFSPLKSLLQVHRGISRELKRKLIIAFLENRIIRTPKS